MRGARRFLRPILPALLAGLVGCATIPLSGRLATQTTFQGRTDVIARVAAEMRGPIEVRVPTVADVGPVAAMPVQAGDPSGRVAIIDLDGPILNASPAGPYSAGENPVSAFREKLQAAAGEPTIRAVVLRINSPGGSVTACDILAEELRRFRQASGKPVVACLMDLGTSGAYYVAIGADRVIAHPTTVTGGIGAVLNRYNLRDAMAQLSVFAEPVKSAPKVDLGTEVAELDEGSEQLLQEMVDGFAARFRARVAGRRPAMTPADAGALADGRVVAAPKALQLHLIDRVGYLPDAIDEAARLGGAPGGEVVALTRRDAPARSIYAATPNTPIQSGLIPFSIPGLERSSLPTFLYLWAPDPTVVPRSGR
jgi:protease-4